MSAKEAAAERLLSEEPFPISEASLRFPGNPTRRTVDNWVRIGVQTPYRAIPVRLECVKIGGKRHTSLPAYYRFIHATNE